MNISIETINEFLAVASRDSNWENCAPGMWVRSKKLEGWTPTPTTDDPYTTMPIAVDITPEGNDTEAIVLMYGWMSPFNDDDSVDEDARERVRVIMYFANGGQSVSVQRQGKTVEQFPDMGEGMMPESIAELRRKQKGE